MKKRIAILLCLVVLLPVAAGAIPVDRSPAGFLSDLWTRLVELVVGEDKVPPASGEDALGPMADPDGVQVTTDLPSPGGELGPMTDPNG